MGINGRYVMWTLPLKEGEHQAENVFEGALINGSPRRSQKSLRRFADKPST